MEKLRQKIQSTEWGELQFNENITVEDTDLSILTVNGDTANFFLLDRKETEEGTIVFENSYNQLIRIEFPVNFPLENLITQSLKIKHYSKLNEVFQFNANRIQVLKITDKIESFDVANNILSFNPQSLLEVIETYNAIYDDAKNYSLKFVNYKSREYHRIYFGIERERKTLTNKGEFTFLIDRFNLPTKRTKLDFQKYLNTNDFLSLQELCLQLIQKEVFDSDFMTVLNDYFIKARLEDIIKLGKEILSLKSSDIKTKTAKKTVSKIEPDGRKIKQLESVWQKYFENFLSFLIFSYRDLYPKIELSVHIKKKYPDFIGINHYGGVDIIEIKTHLKYALTKDPSHDNYAFSSEMSKALIQTINYMDALVQEKITQKKVKEDLKGKILEGNIYRPQGLIVISSYDHLVKGIKPSDAEFQNVKRDFTKLRNGLNNISIITFDELLGMAENYKDNIVK